MRVMTERPRSTAANLNDPRTRLSWRQPQLSHLDRGQCVLRLLPFAALRLALRMRNFSLCHEEIDLILSLRPKGACRRTLDRAAAGLQAATGAASPALRPRPMRSTRRAAMM